MDIILKINNPNPQFNSLPRDLLFSVSVNEATTVQEVFSGDRHISMGTYYPLSAVHWGYEIILPYVLMKGDVKWYVSAKDVNFYEFASTHNISLDLVEGESDVMEIGGFITPLMNSLDQSYQIACVVYDYLSQNVTIGGILQLYGIGQIFMCLTKCTNKIKRFIFSKVNLVRQKRNDIIVKDEICKFVHKIAKKQKCNEEWYCYKDLKLKTERKASPLAVIDFVYNNSSWDAEKLAFYLKISRKEARRLLRMLLYILDELSGLYFLSDHGAALYKTLQQKSYYYKWTEEEYLRSESLSDKASSLDKMRRFFSIR